MLLEIERAMRERIQNSLLGSVVSVGSYQNSLAGLKSGRIADVLPAVFLQYLGGKYEAATMTSRKHVTDWAMLSASRDLRPDSARTESATGAYAILTALEILFMAHDLGLEITPIVPVSVQSVWDKELEKQGVAMYALNFRTSYLVEQPDEETALALLKVKLKGFSQEPADDRIVDFEAEVDLT